MRSGRTPGGGPATVVDVVRGLAERRPTEIAFVFLDESAEGGTSLTYAALDRGARAIAASLQQAGLSGQRAVLAYPHGREYVLGFLGCLLAGVVGVPAYSPPGTRTQQALARLAAIARDVRPAVVLSVEQAIAAAGWREAFGERPTLPTDALGASVDADSWQHPWATGATLAYIQYTSGSTSAPRGVLLDHANLLASCAQSARRFGADSSWRWVGWLPLFHDFGLIGGVLRPLFSGYQSILMPPQAFLARPIRWLQAISKYRATISAAPNFAFDLVSRKTSRAEVAELDLSSWRVAQNGAEPVRKATLDRFVEKFGPAGLRAEAVCPGYGLAEATLGVATDAQGQSFGWRSISADALALGRAQPVQGTDSERAIVSCGRPYPDEEVAIVEPERRTRRADGEIGEVWVRGPNVARGYWARPDETTATFRACIAESGSPVREFLRTGDLGFVLDGELFLTGRVKDSLVIRGRNIYPQDVEASVEGSHPTIRPGGVAALLDPFANDAERLLVIAEVDRTDVLELVLRQVRASVTQQHGVQPAVILLVQPRSLPHTSSGKLQRFACRAAYAAGSLPVVAAWRDTRFSGAVSTAPRAG